ncbi:hypothetical protein Hypma_008173 [Hypsizygus marmoreus]|uniref:Uncharacterized protein n=1 Tax=Hypsizygus marmoreus TaxID=39966 RepID=A0A369JYG9_HYPMA|nr:hypothetical protein Hypma_008173 [Hypsizygus marmoreus]
MPGSLRKTILEEAHECSFNSAYARPEKLWQKLRKVPWKSHDPSISIEQSSEEIAASLRMR